MTNEAAPALDAALIRLAASRARLMQTLPPAASPDARPGRSRWRVLARWLTARSSFAALLKPGGGALRAWWQRQRWRPAAELAVDMAEQQLMPVVRRHPWLAVAGAAALGAVLMRVRPWRWSLVAHQASLWRGAALAGLVAELTRPETQAALFGALFAASTQAAAAAEPAAPEPTPVPTAP